MVALLRSVWDDDRAAVIAVELLLVLGILVFGLIPGLVALRNSANAALISVANLFTALSPTFSFSNLPLGGVAIVIGINGTSANFLTGSQVAPIVLPNTLVVPPSP